ncbi:Eyes absent-like protein [Aphelenchoides bicaudatus]|nr:Eyes absent-like protein [Aphelenchoides bicaudatus]
MPSDPLKSSGWTGDGQATEVSDQQISQYYNAAASQYNQHYGLYNSAYYRFPYLPAANASAIYGPGYSAGFDYNGYPAAYGVQYYNKSMATNNTSPISTFQQYTNNLVNAGNFGAVAAAINQQQSNGTTPQATGYYGNGAQKGEAGRPKKTKRKKQSTGGGKQELTYKRVYIWELDDLFGDEFSQQLLYNPEMKKLIGQVLSQCFQLSASDDFDHANIEDATVDETLQDANLYPNSADPQFGQLKSDGTTPDKQGENPQAPMQGEQININALDNIKRMAACQQRIRSVYNCHKQDIMGLIKSYGMEAEVPTLCQMLEPLRRLDASRPLAQCMKLINERSSQAVSTGGPQQAVIVVAQEPLAFAIAKLIVHGSSVQVANRECLFGSKGRHFLCAGKNCGTVQT